jgi:predicted porin
MAREQAIALVFVAIIFGGGIVALQAAYTDSVRGAGDQTVITDESTAITAGEVSTLNNSNLDVVYAEQDNVTVTQDGTVYPPEGNWSWVERNGTLAIDSSTDLNTSKDAVVDYAFYNATQEQETAQSIGFVFTDTLSSIILFGLGGAFLLAAMYTVTKVR